MIGAPVIVALDVGDELMAAADGNVGLDGPAMEDCVEDAGDVLEDDWK